MGRRGPPRTPTSLLKIAGSNRAASREGKEPKPDASRPKTSVKMSAPERRVFNTVCKKLKGMGLQADTDGDAIARYAKNLARYNLMSAFTDKHGDTYPVYDRHKDGTKSIRIMKRFPESNIRNELETTLLRIEKDFGLTPSARSGLEVDVVEKLQGLEAKYFG